MNRPLSAALAIAMLFGIQAPMSAAGETGGADPSKRSFVLFLNRSSFFGLNPIDFPIDPKSNLISDTVRLVGGELDGTTWQISGDSSFLGVVRKAYTFGGSNHPNSNIVGLFSASPKAAEELRLADEAASREDGYMAWGYGLVTAAAISLALASSDTTQPISSTPLFYGGVGLGVASLVPAVLGGWSRKESWNHMGRAVRVWNAGQ